METETRKSSRAQTERALMDAALEILERDGVLAGLNMQEVADLAGVNRGLIHHYFGSRQALVRAAIDARLKDAAPEVNRRRPLDPVEKGERQFRDYRASPAFPKLLALLAMDGDESLEPLIYAQARLEDMEREVAEGAFVADTDVEALLTLHDATLLGYFLIRESASRQLRIPLRELDRRVRALQGRYVGAIRPGSAPEP